MRITTTESLAESVKAMIPEDLPEPSYKCPACKDTGYIGWMDDDGNLFAKECECRKAARGLARLKRSGLGKLIDRCTLDAFDDKEQWQRRIKQSALKYLDAYDTGRWFYIGGQSGCGKTHICTAITARIINQGHSAKYMLWREESTRLKSMANSEEYHRELAGLENVYCLYIDDFFKGGCTEADVKLAFELIDARYRLQLPTIISSEYLTQDLETIDEAIAGRIREKSTIVNIAKCAGRNYRVMGRKIETAMRDKSDIDKEQR